MLLKSSKCIVMQNDWRQTGTAQYFSRSQRPLRCMKQRTCPQFKRKNLEKNRNKSTAIRLFSAVPILFINSVYKNN